MIIIIGNNKFGRKKLNKGNNKLKDIGKDLEINSIINDRNKKIC